LKQTKTDVIIIGGGPAGMAAAITSAKAGLKTVLLERGDFCGSKNMFGGAIYTQPTLEVYPDFIENAPIERGIERHTYAILGKKDGTIVSYNNPKTEDYYSAYSVIRAKWDRWCAQKAEEAGAFIIPKILVEDLIKENGKFCGIKTANEEYRAKIIILAEGANSILAEKNGLKEKIKPENVAVSVKQTLILDKEKIQDRFNLNDENGVCYTIMGGELLGLTALGFIYTNLDSISIGLGITLSDLNKTGKTPYDYLEDLKNHPSISPLIKDAQVKEYSAHLIPEGGYNAIPQLAFDGLMIVGDAAMLVNNVHWEGTNIAMLSGKYAAETAIEAIKNNDFSKKALSTYEKKLKNSFIIKDLYAYRNVMSTIENNAETFLGFYPQKINQFMKTFTETDSIPKKYKYRRFISETLKERNILKIAVDAVKIAKLAKEAIL